HYVVVNLFAHSLSQRQKGLISILEYIESHIAVVPERRSSEMTQREGKHSKVISQKDPRRTKTALRNRDSSRKSTTTREWLSTVGEVWAVGQGTVWSVGGSGPTPRNGR